MNGNPIYINASVYVWFKYAIHGVSSSYSGNIDIGFSGYLMEDNSLHFIGTDTLPWKNKLDVEIKDDSTIFNRYNNSSLISTFKNMLEGKNVDIGDPNPLSNKFTPITSKGHSLAVIGVKNSSISMSIDGLVNPIEIHRDYRNVSNSDQLEFDF